ncbi:16S rRNA (cytosine(967)-C(5))-methyltransferase [Saccharospirillum sp. MSK14-1]|uniref:16S rRNA (cytosine(967)-C(5))-methyltransferase RsmB n=1 Tax=Saccharospirillum sp. MSK14-1 TaxID=1897632 RepID=UPI000D3D0E62|nr:16S rRNA (cytosine(967)-C(5))-methyltransferase RsmB [Saccharospirillum sp. MSK14-1]PTY37675.1 16S rRNA (cytosine(967)-C(5))-methyltransferase [Saccharospirillum sp. MSK14-1]
MTNSRVLAAQTLLQLVDQGRSLNDLLPSRREQLPEEERGFYQQLVYGCARHYLSLDELTRKLLDKPIQRKERVVHMLLVVGLYQLWQLDLPEHAALYETVDGTKTLKKPWAAKLLNAALRRFQREGDELIAGLQNSAGYPGWLTRQLRQAYPDQWQAVMDAGNVQGPMTLRVNQSRIQRDDWLALADNEGLEATACEQTPSAVTLAQPVPVLAIPGFSDGDVSVQDEAAQQCALLLAPEDGERLLDACAAPGGKTGHLLESAQIEVTALDIDDSRLQRVTENLDRLGLSAHLQAADAADLNAWWDGEPFDRILLDAPCSGTGVIRRHPDIKLLRRPKDIDFLTQVQDRLLAQLWRTLKPGGRLLYATCSILPRENSARIAAFLQRQSDAQRVSLTLAGDAPAEFGVQWLPQPGGHDGFYFALLEKAEATA